jgi:DNA-binding response OmpR family regulator
LSLLVEESPNIVSRELLAKKIWDQDLELLNSRTIDVHIQRIRFKLGPDLGARLKNIRSKGYCFS